LTYANSANLFQSPLRSDVLQANKEDGISHEAEGMLQHELLQLSVVSAAPVRSGQEGPADLNLTPALIVAMET
jgi:hypothetical protein